MCNKCSSLVFIYIHISYSQFTSIGFISIRNQFINSTILNGTSPNNLVISTKERKEKENGQNQITTNIIEISIILIYIHLDQLVSIRQTSFVVRFTTKGNLRQKKRRKTTSSRYSKWVENVGLRVKSRQFWKNWNENKMIQCTIKIQFFDSFPIHLFAIPMKTIFFFYWMNERVQEILKCLVRHLVHCSNDRTNIYKCFMIQYVHWNTTKSFFNNQ